MHSVRSFKKDDECTNGRCETQSCQSKKQPGFNHRGRRCQGQQCAIEGKREWPSTQERGPKRTRGRCSRAHQRLMGVLHVQRCTCFLSTMSLLSVRLHTLEPPYPSSYRGSKTYNDPWTSICSKVAYPNAVTSNRRQYYSDRHPGSHIRLSILAR